MRTKSEAAANPRAGDRWRKRDNGRTVTWAPEALVQFTTFNAPTTKQLEWLDEFTRWCQDATYLGGSDEKA